MAQEMRSLLVGGGRASRSVKRCTRSGPVRDRRQRATVVTRDGQALALAPKTMSCCWSSCAAADARCRVTNWCRRSGPTPSSRRPTSPSRSPRCARRSGRAPRPGSRPCRNSATASRRRSARSLLRLLPPQARCRPRRDLLPMIVARTPGRYWSSGAEPRSSALHWRSSCSRCWGPPCWCGASRSAGGRHRRDRCLARRQRR